MDIMLFYLAFGLFGGK